MPIVGVASIVDHMHPFSVQIMGTTLTNNTDYTYYHRSYSTLYNLHTFLGCGHVYCVITTTQPYCGETLK